MICTALVCISRKIIKHVFWSVKFLDLFKTLMLGYAPGTIDVTNVKLCMMELLIGFYLLYHFQ